MWELSVVQGHKVRTGHLEKQPQLFWLASPKRGSGKLLPE